MMQGASIYYKRLASNVAIISGEGDPATIGSYVVGCRICKKTESVELNEEGFDIYPQLEYAVRKHTDCK